MTLVGADLPEKTLELDELWSFVFKKSQKVWVWIALCATTRQVVAFVVGDRSEETCQILWNEVPQSYKLAHLYSDFWSAYQLVLPSVQHQAVGKDSGKTNHIERWNNTLRQRLAQFVRKTLSFSKCVHQHFARLKLFIHCYNRERSCAILP
ncbi:IS1 family transposase [Deinococcus sp.]|uniref:IS1 family transposase n=1 Tax=Deinococcus sp. TaxID=47478 RepID=UPI0025FA186B|nr:IS1 family transposase [Deinococcus sp.]